MIRRWALPLLLLAFGVFYLLPLATCFVALRLLFRALKPHRRRVWAPYERFKARFA